MKKYVIILLATFLLGNALHVSAVDYYVGGQPSGISYEPITESIWVSDFINRRLQKLEPLDGSLKGSVATSVYPEFIRFKLSQTFGNVMSYLKVTWAYPHDDTTMPPFLIVDEYLINPTTGAYLGGPYSGLFPYEYAYSSQSPENVWYLNWDYGIYRYNINGTYDIIDIPGAYYIAYDEYSNTVWVLTYGNVVKVNPANGAIIGTCNLGFDPSAIATDPITNSMWIIRQSPSLLYKINPSTCAINGSFAITSGSGDITFDAKTNSMWTSSWSTGYVSKISIGVSTTPDLTASNTTPTTAFINTPTTLSATITSANAPTGGSFSNFFQIATAPNGGGVITDLTPSTMPALATGGTGTATYLHTFLTAGTYYVRACADKTSSVGGGVITESNELNNCSPIWTPVLVLDPDTIIFNGAGCVLPALGGPCNVTAWWNVVLPGVETVNIKVEGPPGSGYAKVFKNLPVNSSSLAKTLNNAKNLAAITFPPSPTSVPQSSAFQVPISVAGQLTLSLLRTFDQSVLKSIPPVVSCSPGQIIVNGVCVTPCANGATTASSCTVCPPAQAFDGTSCMFCVGGCSGAGGVSSNSGATCNNLALNPPLCSLCPPGQDTSSGVCADIVVTPACDNDTTCDPGETILNCPRDCKVRYREF